jgi:hypothetical protein
VPILALLADAELAEDAPEQVLAGERAGDLGERALREPQVLGGKLGSGALAQAQLRIS